MIDYKKRCEDCACLILKNGEWTCDECFGQKCSDIDDCPEGVTVEAVQNAQLTKEQEKQVKKMLGNAKSEAKTERKPRTIKENPEKIDIINRISAVLDEIPESFVEITNKQREIVLKIGENDYKITLTATRKPKN